MLAKLIGPLCPAFGPPPRRATARSRRNIPFHGEFTEREGGAPFGAAVFKRCRSGVTCALITEPPSVGLHTGAILTDAGSNETRVSLSKASRKGRETAIVRRIKDGSTEPLSDQDGSTGIGQSHQREPRHGPLRSTLARIGRNVANFAETHSKLCSSQTQWKSCVHGGASLIGKRGRI